MLSALILALAASSMASPVAKRQTTAATPITDSFDDHAFGRVGGYNGLVYYGCNVVTSKLFPNGTQSLVPHSGIRYASGSTELDFLQQGQISFNSYIQIKRNLTTTASFDLTSFYTACAVDDLTTFGLAQGCTIAVSGFKVTGEQTEVATFAFEPSTVNEAPFVLAKLPGSFTGLANVTIGVATGSFFTERTTLALDDVVHVNN